MKMVVENYYFLFSGSRDILYKSFFWLHFSPDILENLCLNSHIYNITEILSCVRLTLTDTG